MSADASGFRSQSISRHGIDPQSQNILSLASEDLIKIRYPDSKVCGDNIGPICGRQDPGGPRVGPMNFAIWVCMYFRLPYPLVIYLWLPLLSVGPLATNLSWISIKNTNIHIQHLNLKIPLQELMSNSQCVDKNSKSSLADDGEIWASIEEGRASSQSLPAAT